MQLYVGLCHVVSVEIAVTMAVPIENPGDCDLRGIIRFLQAVEILGYLAEEASSRVEFLLHDSAHPHTAQQTQTLPLEQIHWDIFEHPPYSPDLAPSDFFLFSKLKENLAGKRFANDEDLKDAG